MAQDVAPPVAVAKASLRRQGLLSGGMNRNTVNRSNIAFPGSGALPPSAVEPLSVTCGNALIEVEIGRVCGHRILVQGQGDQPQAFHGAKLLAQVTICVPRFQAILEAGFKQLLWPESSSVARRKFAEL